MYFWEDHWVGDRPLSFVFPRLYHLSSLKNCQMLDFLVWSRSLVSFSFGFRWPLSSRVTMVVSLLSLIEGEFRLGKKGCLCLESYPYGGFLL